MPGLLENLAGGAHYWRGLSFIVTVSSAASCGAPLKIHIHILCSLDMPRLL
jgi:hypothetical protein